MGCGWRFFSFRFFQADIYVLGKSAEIYGLVSISIRYNTPKIANTLNPYAAVMYGAFVFNWLVASPTCIAVSTRAM